VGHAVSTLMHIGNIAMRLGRPLAWDPNREEFPNDPEANSMRQRTLRAPWTI
jgi:hypothetical protein